MNKQALFAAGKGLRPFYIIHARTHESFAKRFGPFVELMRRLDGDAVVQRCSPATTAETADSYAAEAEIACCFGKVIRRGLNLRPGTQLE